MGDSSAAAWHQLQRQLHAAATSTVAVATPSSPTSALADHIKATLLASGALDAAAADFRSRANGSKKPTTTNRPSRRPTDALVSALQILTLARPDPVSVSVPIPLPPSAPAVKHSPPTNAPSPVILHVSNDLATGPMVRIEAKNLVDLALDVPRETIITFGVTLAGLVLCVPMLRSQCDQFTIDNTLPIRIGAYPYPHVPQSDARGLVFVSTWSPGARHPGLLGTAALPTDSSWHSVPLLSSSGARVAGSVSMCVTWPHPQSLPPHLPHPWPAAAVARWWQAHLAASTRRLGAAPPLPSVPVLVTDEAGDRTPLPVLLARPVGPIPGVVTAIDAVRWVRDLPTWAPPFDQQGATGMAWQSPAFSVAAHAVQHDRDRALLLVVVLRGLQYNAALVLGADARGPGAWVVVRGGDTPQTTTTPTRPFFISMTGGGNGGSAAAALPTVTHVPPPVVAAVVTFSGIWANETAARGAVAHWDWEKGDGWRPLVANLPDDLASGVLAGPSEGANNEVRRQSSSMSISPRWWDLRIVVPVSRWAGMAAVDMAEALAKAIRDQVAEQREFFELDVAWDESLCSALTRSVPSLDPLVATASSSSDPQQLPSYLTKSNVGSTVRTALPSGWTFRAAVVHTTVPLMPYQSLKDDNEAATAAHVTAAARRIVGEWSRNAAAQALLREPAEMAARWAIGVHADATGVASSAAVRVVLGVAGPDDDQHHHHQQTANSMLTTTFGDDNDDGGGEGLFTSVMDDDGVSFISTSA
ncbi:hypothetical protein BC828DRAFT_404409 [Blastocladiella britannica]|nr:hypothetical protein BC828DRAFT_404409 [Blastocladiella britannica]